ncbi:hypothetical protein QTO30_12820 [Yoonia sp. GPGPB17]|uniref:hypothetical protein n=1 Tax=Yoonia sp. GPGPB17 TaxID=3026147 RepID=UPI0030BC96EC
MIKLSIVPVIGIGYIAVVLVASYFVPAVTKYAQFATFLIALAPYFVLRAYVGLLGSAFVFYRMQRFDLMCNTMIALSVAATGLAVSFAGLPFATLLWAISITNMIFAITIARRLFLHLGRAPAVPGQP